MTFPNWSTGLMCSNMNMLIKSLAQKKSNIACTNIYSSTDAPIIRFAQQYFFLFDFVLWAKRKGTKHAKDSP